MWYPAVALLAAFLLLHAAASADAADPPAPRAKRLTTFGKTPTTETEPKIPRGKECRSDDDCTALEFTTCKVDTDQRRRCLCHDHKPPANGECATKRRELHQNCLYDHECIQGAECVVNSTIKANEKRCYCRFGYIEEDNECNSAPSLSALVSLVLFTTFLLVTHTN